jgi:hypothetical protein
MRTRKSWREKMDNPNLPKVVAIPPKMQKRLGAGTLLIPSPRDVESAIRAIPEGTVRTVSQIRADLAAKYGTTSACPLCTGMFVRIVGEAAEEDARAGKSDIAPYWRVLRDDGTSNPKLTKARARLRLERRSTLSG